MRLLDLRAFELKSSVHDVFDHVWASLVHTDVEAGSLSVYDKLDGKIPDPSSSNCLLTCKR